MNLTPKLVFAAVKDTLTDPAAMARQVMALRLTVAEAWMALAATAVSATIFTSLMQLALVRTTDLGAAEIFSHPFLIAVSQFAAMSLGAFLMWRVGRFFGGTGSFAQALSLVAWLEVVLILLNLAEVAIVLILPGLAGIFFIAMMLALFYLLTHFTATLNGFTSLAKTLVAILLTSFLTLIVLSLLLYPFFPVPHV